MHFCILIYCYNVIYVLYSEQVNIVHLASSCWPASQRILLCSYGGECESN